MLNAEFWHLSGLISFDILFFKNKKNAKCLHEPLYLEHRIINEIEFLFQNSVFWIVPFGVWIHECSGDGGAAQPISTQYTNPCLKIYFFFLLRQGRFLSSLISFSWACYKYPRCVSSGLL